MARRNSDERMLLPKPPLLITESASEFEALREALEREIKPRGIIEQTYVADIGCIAWEIQRLRRCKTESRRTSINASSRSWKRRSIRSAQNMQRRAARREPAVVA